MFAAVLRHIYFKSRLPRCTSVSLLLIALKIIVLFCVSTSFYVLWSKYSIVIDQYAVKFGKTVDNPHLKYILLWTENKYDPDFFQEGQRVFMSNNCSFQNCYISFNSNFLGDVTKFDAVVFNLRGLGTLNGSYPTKRGLHQKYIFFALESGAIYPVCGYMYNEYFNWTASFRLDADINLPYFLIKDVNGRVVGPKQDIQWVTNMQDVDEDFDRRLQNKSKAAAWFVSRCKSLNYRECLVGEVQKYLKTENVTVDVYGRCGILKCPRKRHINCTKMLQNDYHFYMAMENSFDDDYVTEKILTAVQNSAVPVVYGGANYSWFLPPGSYLDARVLSPQRLARRMHRLMNNKKKYKNYFKWTRYYTYHDATASNVCSLCSALNNKTKFEAYSVNKDFVKWWNRPEKYARCIYTPD